MTDRRRTRAAIVTIAIVLALGSCSSDDSDAEATPTTSTTPMATSTTAPTTTAPARDGGAPVGGPPDEVLLTCDGTTATLSTELVSTQSDGIHVTVHNTSDAEVSVNFVDRGELVSPGTTVTVQDMKPRTMTVSCGYDLNRTIVPAGSVEVVDPAGNWIATDIDCTKLPLSQWEEPTGDGATPEEAIRWWSANRPNDLIEPHAPDDEIAVVGYPDAEVKRYVSRHDGHDTNIFMVTRDESGAWHALAHERCPR